MALYIFIILSLIGVVDFFAVKKDDGKSFFKIIGSFILFLSIFWGITYFVDRYNYETMFDNIEDYNTDYIFKLFTAFGYKYGWDFDDIYHLHILVMGAFCTLFVSRFTNKILFIVFFLCVFRYVDYANQIRYYFGFFIALYALYLIITKKKYFFGFVFAIVAVFSHFSLIILFIIPFVYNYLGKVSAKSLFIFNLIVLLFLGVVINLVVDFFPLYAKYFVNAEGQSSFLGGLFDSVPAILMAILVMNNHKKLIKNNSSLILDHKYKFLFSLSIFSFLLISYGILFRIVMDRFVFSFLIVWLCLLIYSLKGYSSTTINTQRKAIFFRSIFIVIWFFYASFFILGRSYYLDEALLMLAYD